MPTSSAPSPEPAAGAVPAGGAGPEQLLRRIELTVLRRLDGQLHGDYRSLFRGAGLDLADLREYQFADDVRRIDWNVTARLQVPHVREYHEDRELTAWFLCDLSGSVDFGSGAQRKLEVASEFTALMARVLTARGNRVGAMLYGTQVDTVLPARSGRRHVLHLLRSMTRRPPLRLVGKEAGEGVGKAERPRQTELGVLLRAAQGVLRRRSLVFVVSDFISEPGWERPLAQLAQRHEVVAVRLHDPLERQLPDLGLLLMQDAESGEQLYVDTGDARLRARFAAAAARRDEALGAAFAQAGVDALELSTAEPLLDTVLRFADARKRRGRSSGSAPLRRAEARS
ncbi:MAG: DUF58 domain-containing protein [Burkholderiales bacterium]|nr:DUF58 domain-containing protein [Burkholderiales bacterium]MCA3228278.1 DUF58 domain-containing protein [Burkholderiales bacterium]